MNEINKITKELAATSTTLKELKTKETVLKVELQALLKAAGKDKDENEFGTFTIARRPKWVYSDDTMDLINQHKATIAGIEEEARHTGAATEEVTEYILFKAHEG